MSQKNAEQDKNLQLIYNLLPGIEQQEAYKLARTLENKKSITLLKQNIAIIHQQLGPAAKQSGNITAKLLLDEITLSAALHQSRIYHNRRSIKKLGKVLALSPYAVTQLSKVYGSFSSRLYFDTELDKALKQENIKKLPSSQQAQHAVSCLLEKAATRMTNSVQTAQENKLNILKMADLYHFSVVLTTRLIDFYTQPAAIDFLPEFEQQFNTLADKNDNKNFCASLAARIMLYEITFKDAQDILHLQKLISPDVLEEDLLTISYRYLRKKSPQEIAAVFEGILHKLPHRSSLEENLGLAVDVLLDGTQDGLQQACQIAAIRRDKETLRSHLVQDPLFYGYEDTLSERFGGKKNFAQLHKEMQNLLQALPYCQNPAENKEIACKVLLKAITLPQATQQAKYLQDLKTSSLTKGLAPEVLKGYLGNKSATNLIHFFKTALVPYTFWRTDREKHIFALRTLVGELNGFYNSRVSQFVLNMLEQGSSLQDMSGLLLTLQEKRNSPKEVELLLEKYQLSKKEWPLP